MRTLTFDIEIKIKAAARDAIAESTPHGRLIDEEEVECYFKLLCDLWINEQLTFDWELH